MNNPPRSPAPDRLIPPTPTRRLPPHPDLDQLKRQAKELLDAFRAGDTAAIAEVQAHYRGADSTAFALHDAQLVLARAYGFDSWPKLKAYVDGATVARLADAVGANDLDRVRAMLDVRPELVHTDMAEANEHRAIHYAVLNRSPEMVRLLMERGADARKGIWPHRDATSAFTIAIERGYDEIVDIIRTEEQRRGGRHRPDPRAVPALHQFFERAEHGDEAGALAILQAHPFVIHERTSSGWTPLHVATAILSEPLVTWLLDHGANVNAAGENGATPLAATGGRARWDSDDTPARAKRLGRLLLERGAGLNVWAAVGLGEIDWLRAQHQKGVRWSGKDRLVSMAVESGRDDVLTFLLELGLDPDERHRLDLEEEVYSWGQPLRQCARFGRHAMAGILLEHGADPNTNVYAASQAMTEACMANDRTMIALLERYGGFVTAGDAGFFGLVDVASQMLKDEAAGRLRERSVHPGSSVASTLLTGGADGAHPEIVRLALEHLDWPPGDERWHWNLMRPLAGRSESDRERSFACFRLMVERAGPNAPAPYGRTILHDVAAGWPTGEKGSDQERVVLATLLLDAGARLDVRDDLLKSTPLGWACRWGRVELVRLLLNRGADPIEADAESWATPRAWAEKMKHDDVVAILQEGRARSSRV